MLRWLAVRETVTARLLPRPRRYGLKGTGPCCLGRCQSRARGGCCREIPPLAVEFRVPLAACGIADPLQRIASMMPSTGWASTRRWCQTLDRLVVDAMTRP